MTALAILGWVVVSLLGFLAALLLVPFHLEAQGAVDDDGAAGRAQVRWGWWLVVLRADARGVRLRLLGLSVWRLRFERRRDNPAKQKKIRRRRPRFSLRRLGQGRTMLRLARVVWRAIPVTGSVTGTVGLSDPADTALLLQLARRWNGRSARIALAPDWLDATLRLEGLLRVHLWPARILAALLWHVIRDGRTRRGLWSMVRTRR